MSTELYNRLPIFLQNAACSLVGINIRRNRYSRIFHRFLAWLESTDKWSLQQLREYQNQRLRYMIRHCYDTVPFYRDQFDSLRIKPDDIRKVEDLELLPILTKQIVRANRDKLLSTKFKKTSVVVLSTSGTTGAGMSLYKQKSTISFQWAVWWRFRRRFGLQLRHKHANFGGKQIVPLSQNTAPFWRYNLPLHQTYFSEYHITDENLPYYFDHLNRHKYVYYCGYPSVINLLAEFMLKRNLTLSNGPKIIATGSETLLPSQARLIQDVFGCPVVDQYGAAELVCNMSQCPQGVYHEDMELGIIERQILEEHSGGTSARVIATGLIDEAMPLLRYDIGDVITFSDLKTRCSCGRESPTARYIDGRIESCILTPDGRRIGRLARVFADMVRVYESQIIQENIDRLRVLVVKADGYSNRDEKFFEQKIRDIVGTNIRIIFEYVDHIPREKNGKLRAVISKLNKR